jgi:CDP-diacylglycerol--glycerol-3-phosphate 3-phosphatidyltransferase
MDARFKAQISQLTDPAARWMAAKRLPANLLTLVGLLLGLLAAVLVGSGDLLAGGIVLVLAGVPDLLDGAVARAGRGATIFGSFADSVSDRVTDAAVFIGLDVWLVHTGRPALGLLALLVMVMASLISYERAKAESLGLSGKVGLAERGERIVLVVIGLLFPVLLMPVLWVLAAATLITVVQRFVTVLSQTTRMPEPVERLAQRRDQWVTLYQQRRDARARNVRSRRMTNRAVRTQRARRSLVRSSGARRRGI